MITPTHPGGQVDSGSVVKDLVLHDQDDGHQPPITSGSGSSQEHQGVKESQVLD